MTFPILPSWFRKCKFSDILKISSCLSGAPCAQAGARTALADGLHMRYGHALFAARDYDGAMAHFGMCSAASPVVLLRLFPSLAPPALLQPLAPAVAGTPPQPGAHCTSLSLNPEPKPFKRALELP